VRSQNAGRQEEFRAPEWGGGGLWLLDSSIPLGGKTFVSWHRKIGEKDRGKTGRVKKGDEKRNFLERGQ